MDTMLLSRYTSSENTSGCN